MKATQAIGAAACHGFLHRTSRHGESWEGKSSVAHAIPNLDAAGHDQTMELAKTFLQRCPSVRPTVNKEKADFYVTLNWTEKTRFFIGGKVFHKPDQIIVENRDGDILYSGIARSVGGDVEGACRTIFTLCSKQQV